ncbi:Protein RALF-like 33 [Hibiscus syriacus]|uniref:Protein RALF-like 33 n=1 Tax=Hibiscus syriacus TaxID=106335 RepID=A0A6A2YZX8_HIBSY|nr:protein RALF-like 33 [Hibiscus syriacus]KAE8685194.1 Protein RALF-like 33 [Hibiscus syriacus]
MANASGFPSAISVVLTTLVVTSLTVNSSGEHYLSLVPSEAGCQVSVAECVTNDEFDMGSDISRRVLQTTKYISYGALHRDSMPCSRRGASYYNCQPGAEANPYNRGCSTITHCRG